MAWRLDPAPGGGREEPNKIFISVRNFIGVASVAGNACYWGLPGDELHDVATASLYGHAVVDAGVTNSIRRQRRFAGIWRQAVADGEAGVIQVWGIGDVLIQTATTATHIGGLAAPSDSAAYTGSTAGIVIMATSASTRGFDGLPHVLIVSAASVGLMSRGLIRCLH